jgi:hypothetical protein
MKDLAMGLDGNTFTVVDHKWVFTREPIEYIAQKIRHTISVFQGEWFFNRAIGVPYIPSQDQDKVLHRGLIESRLQVRIMQVDGVVKMTKFESHLDKAKRVLTVDFEVQISSGETISQSVEVGA